MNKIIKYLFYEHKYPTDKQVQDDLMNDKDFVKMTPKEMEQLRKNFIEGRGGYLYGVRWIDDKNNKILNKSSNNAGKTDKK